MFFPLRPGYNYKIRTDLSAFLQTAGKKRGTRMKEFIICLCYAAGLGVLSFFLGRLLPKCWLHPDKFPFRTYAWEDKTLEGASDPQVAGKGAGHEQALQKSSCLQKPSRKRLRRTFL